MISIKEFIEWAKASCRNIKENEKCDVNLSNEVRERYKAIPYEYFEFLKQVKQCISFSEKSWFLCEEEYNGKSDIALKWNEFEILSLEAAEDDREWKSEIENWWNRYFPILISVDNEYSFYAIDMESENGTIVYGCEPEFEEVDVVADNFMEFLQIIVNKERQL
ncbi:SMI1/KNR4 family protein [Clostridium sp. P21]|uniref:SMI1/KNR4 family protein n=2 Tax=Clostridium TaxID=1485 RepID=A0A7Y0EFG9_9CLOT|nr:SMI1/KNR4 family protein [Clostridium muellerianum]NMM62436.1 SMI1/KNR4 family protein [Clostridium muellerianum]